MLTYVKVRNLAIVEEVALEPESGLNVLTGETGAGKSLLIDSLQFLSGARASTELVRTGAEKMSAEAVFQLPDPVLKELRAAGLEVDEELIIKRELSTSGRGRVLINGSVASVRELTGTIDRIVEIHGQDESRDRIAGAGFRELLDLYAANERLLSETGSAFRAWQKASSELSDMLKSEQDRLRRVDLLQYQIDEISRAKLEPSQEETLRGEKSILANARQITEATSGALGVLTEDDQATVPQVARALQLLQPLTQSIEQIREIHRELEEIRIRVGEAARALSRFGDAVRHDPRRLEEIEDRLATIERLKRKYGGTINEVLAYLASITDEYERLRDYESTVAKLQQAAQQALATYRRSAEELSARRRAAAPQLESAVREELRDLAMERTRLSIAMALTEDQEAALEVNGRRLTFGPEGFDRVEFLIAPNAGEELRPMSKIASGGELSRLQLAVAAALFKRLERPPEAVTLVFDEIDAGIGGRVAEVVGRKLRELAYQNQVICVTHLPQIASFATTHFRVWKEESAGRTKARIEKLDGDDRIREIARMLGGEKVSASAVAHARELLASARLPRKRARATAV